MNRLYMLKYKRKSSRHRIKRISTMEKEQIEFLFTKLKNQKLYPLSLERKQRVQRFVETLTDAVTNESSQSSDSASDLDPENPSGSDSQPSSDDGVDNKTTLMKQQQQTTFMGKTFHLMESLLRRLKNDSMRELNFSHFCLLLHIDSKTSEAWLREASIINCCHGIKYKMVTNENFNEYLKQIGVRDLVMRQKLSIREPIIKLTKVGDIYTFTSSNTEYGDLTSTFEAGKPFLEKHDDGQEVPAIVTFSGNEMHHIRHCEPNVKIIRKYSLKEVLVTMKVEDIECTQVYIEID